MADPDRRLPASPRKIQRAREDGQVPRSRDLGHFLGLAVCGSALWLLGSPLVAYMQTLLTKGLAFGAPEVTRTSAMAEHLQARGTEALLVVLALGMLAVAAGVLTALLAGGWNFSTKAFLPNFGRSNPINGIKNVLSKQQLINVAKMWLLALVLCAVGGFYLYSRFAELQHLLMLPLPQALHEMAAMIALGLALLMLVIGAVALVDVPLQRYLLLERLKMTVEEAKREAKESEGNQEVKQKIKAKMREMTRRRMIAAVPTADLVVMNPTHYAVALAYNEARMGAPRVVAKGVDAFALRMRDVAKDSKVPVLQSPALARALYAHVPLDGEVPAVLFAAVASVLAWVYQLRSTPHASVAEPLVQVPEGLDPGPSDVPIDELDAEGSA